MKLKIIYTILFLFAGVLEAQSLSLEISLEKEKFLSGEPVFLISKLKNIGTNSVDVFDFNVAFALTKVNITVKNALGEILPITRPYKIIDLYEKSPDLLQPGKIRYESLFISRWFGNAKFKDGMYLENLEFLPGMYTASIDFTCESIIYKSNEVKFQIIEPIDPILKEIRAKMQEAVFIFNSTTSDIKTQHENFKNAIMFLIEKYPLNSYSYLLYASLLKGYYSLQILSRSLDPTYEFDQNELDRIYSFVVENFSNTVLGLETSRSFYNKYKGNSKNNILNKIKQSPFNYLLYESFGNTEKEQK